MAGLKQQYTGSQPTRTQYLQWDSHHTISSKYSVIGNLHHRAKTIWSNNKLLQQEEKHLPQALSNCKYPIWALNRIKVKMNNPAQKKKSKIITTQQNNIPKPYITVPYYKGLGESVKKKCSNYGVQVYFKRRYNHQKPPDVPKGQKIQ